MPTSAAQVTTTGTVVMVQSPTDPRQGARETVCVFVNNPSATDPVGFAIEVYDVSRRTVRVIHEGDLEARESIVIDSPIEISAPNQLRLRVDTMPDPPIHFYVNYFSRRKVS